MLDVLARLQESIASMQAQLRAADEQAKSLERQLRILRDDPDYHLRIVPRPMYGVQGLRAEYGDKFIPAIPEAHP